MTLRERLAAAAVLAGIAGIVTCATALGGWPVGVGVGGVLLVGFGLLLGWDAGPAEEPPVDLEEETDLTTLELLPSPPPGTGEAVS